MLNNLSVFAWMYDGLELHHIVLGSLLAGALLVWAVMHLKRNTCIRRTAVECETLRDRVRNILQYSRDALFGLDLCRRQFEYLSPACLSLTGYTAEEIKEMGPH